MSILASLRFRSSSRVWVNTIFPSWSAVCGAGFYIWSCAWVCIKALLFLPMFEGACPCAKSLAGNARPAPFHGSTPSPPSGPSLSTSARQPPWCSQLTLLSLSSVQHTLALTYFQYHFQLEKLILYSNNSFSKYLLSTFLDTVEIVCRKGLIVKLTF